MTDDPRPDEVEVPFPYVTYAESLRYFNIDPNSNSRFLPGGPNEADITRVLRAIAHEVDNWVGGPDSDCPNWARREACHRLLGYRVGRGSLVGMVGASENVLPGQGSSSGLHSGAWDVLAPWRVISGGAIS